MFKKVIVLDKAKHKKTKFDEVSSQDVASYIGSIPLGFHEVILVAPYCPVIISGDENHLEFIAFGGVSGVMSVFKKSYVYKPLYLQTYPFLNAVLIDKKGNRSDVIGLDESEFVGKEKGHFIFEEGKLSPLASHKIGLIRELNKKRDVSKKLIRELQKYDLLQKQDFKIKYQEETKVVADNFFVVNREKLMRLPDDILALWGKKGWITIIDMHLLSINNFSKLFEE